MRRLLLAILLLIPAIGWAKNPPTVKVTERQVNSTVFAMTESNGATRGMGSGTIIDRDGVILTAKHMNGDVMRFVTADDIVHEATFMGETASGDGPCFYRINDIEKLKKSVAQWSGLSETFPKRGDQVRMIGFPMNRFRSLNFTAAEGNITGGGEFESKIKGRKSTYHGNVVDTSVDKGASGGGAYNDKGEVIGCILAVDEEGRESIICSYQEMIDTYKRLGNTNNTSRVVDVYSSHNCAPCRKFKEDQERGLFQGYTFRWHYVHDYPAPTFIYNGRQTSGYNDPTGLLGFLKGGAQPTPEMQPDYREKPKWEFKPDSEPPRSPWPWAKPAPESPPVVDGTPPAPADEGPLSKVDWSKVKAFVLVKKDNPRMRRFLADGAQLALNKITKNSLHLDIIREHEQPNRYAALVSALDLSAGEWTQWPVLTFDHIVDEGFVKNLILKKIEKEIDSLDFEQSSEFYPEVIFRRSDPRQWSNVQSALSIVDEDYVPVARNGMGLKAIITALFAALFHVVWNFAQGVFGWIMFALHKCGLITERKQEQITKNVSERTAALTAEVLKKQGVVTPPPAPEPPPPQTKPSPPKPAAPAAPAAPPPAPAAPPAPVAPSAPSAPVPPPAKAAE